MRKHKIFQHKFPLALLLNSELALTTTQLTKANEAFKEGVPDSFVVQCCVKQDAYNMLCAHWQITASPQIISVSIRWAFFYSTDDFMPLILRPWKHKEKGDLLFYQHTVYSKRKGQNNELIIRHWHAFASRCW